MNYNHKKGSENDELPRDVEVSLGRSKCSEKVCLIHRKGCLVISRDFLSFISIISSYEEDSYRIWSIAVDTAPFKNVSGAAVSFVRTGFVSFVSYLLATLMLSLRSTHSLRCITILAILDFKYSISSISWSETDTGESSITKSWNNYPLIQNELWMKAGTKHSKYKKYFICISIKSV